MSTNTKLGYTEVADAQSNSHLTINNALAAIADATNAIHTDATTTLAVTISDAEYVGHQIFDFTGTHASAYTVDFPDEAVAGTSTERWFIFHNGDATYAATIDSDTGGGTTVEVPADSTAVIFQDGLNFYMVAGGGGDFLTLGDTPSAFTAAGGYQVRVNSGATALEFVAADAGVGVGSYSFIESAEYSAVGTADLVFDPANYAHIKVKGWFKPVTDAVTLDMLISDDDGATYETGANYRYSNIWHDTGAGAITHPGAAGAVAARIATDCGNATDEYVSFEITFPYIAEAGLKQHWYGTATRYAAAGTFTQEFISGVWDVADEVNGARFQFSSGNISDGRIEVYGVSALAPGALTITAITASETLTLDRANTYLRCNSGSTITLTVPPNSTTAFPIGTQMPGVQVGAGIVTFAQGAGVTINYPTSFSLSTAEAGAPFSIIKVGTDEWDLAGQLA